MTDTKTTSSHENGLTRRSLLRAASATPAAAMAAACAGLPGGSSEPGPALPQPAPGPVAQPGAIKVGLILPTSATGNAGAVARAMKNAVDLAIAEFNATNIQIVPADDGGTAQGAATAADQVLTQGVEIILGPLFSHSVNAAGQTARARNVPVIGFSTDANVASRRTYLLSFLPETDVERGVAHAAQQGRRSAAVLIPEGAYGQVADAAFRGAAARNGVRTVAAATYPADRGRMAQVVQTNVRAITTADLIFIPDTPEGTAGMAAALAQAGVQPGRIQLLGTGLWNSTALFADPNMQGAWFPAPEPGGFADFSRRYRQKFGEDPTRNSTLAYDAASLVAALVKTQGAARFAEETLTNASGFAGVDGVFRFRADGTNERGLAMLRMAGGQTSVVSPAPRSFRAGA
jgi:ABC-type branched-subunit amino acid transport system substrate-binding protein